MNDMHQTEESQANTLCKSCGLCCSGHLFIWVRLKATELDRSQALGLNVIRSDPRQRGFTQPCPLWQGQCTIYNSLDYPRVCRAYHCKLLKEVLEGNITLADALATVQQTKNMIVDVQAYLPVSPNNNFRERLVTYLEGRTGLKNSNPELRAKAKNLLACYEGTFGVNDLIEDPADTDTRQ